jgi:hypothetical protein
MITRVIISTHTHSTRCAHTSYAPDQRDSATRRSRLLLTKRQHKCTSVHVICNTHARRAAVRACRAHRRSPPAPRRRSAHGFITNTVSNTHTHLSCATVTPQCSVDKRRRARTQRVGGRVGGSFRAQSSCARTPRSHTQLSARTPLVSNASTSCALGRSLHASRTHTNAARAYVGATRGCW